MTLNIGGQVHDPTDPVRRLLFNVLAMIAEFVRRADWGDVHNDGPGVMPP